MIVIYNVYKEIPRRIGAIVPSSLDPYRKIARRVGASPSEARVQVAHAITQIEGGHGDGYDKLVLRAEGKPDVVIEYPF